MGSPMPEVKEEQLAKTKRVVAAISALCGNPVVARAVGLWPLRAASHVAAADPLALPAKRTRCTLPS